MTQERLDNQREVVKNERRQGIDNQPYGLVEERMDAAMYPGRITRTVGRSSGTWTT